MVAVLAVGPASACVLFEGPSDYPPRDAGATTDAPSAFDAGQDAIATSDAASDGPPVDARGDTGTAGETSTGDGGPTLDANDDAFICRVIGQSCQANVECCSHSCEPNQRKCN